MKTQIEKLKTIFTNNFSSLSPRIFDLNKNTLAVMASYEDGEGGFDEPELIMDCFNDKVDDKAIETMLEAIEEEWVEVEFKKQNNDYVITAGNNEAVYVIKLQIFRIA